MIKKILCVAWLMISAPVFADETFTQLQSYLSDIYTMKSEYKQQLLNDKEELLEESKGHFLLKKPNLFRWTYVSPYEQEVISDGHSVWFYDIDLEQVTVYDSSAQGNQGIWLLLQKPENLSEHYVIKQQSTVAGVTWYKLQSRTSNGDFSEVSIGLDVSGIKFMELKDNFDNTTSIEFIATAYNNEIPDDAFQLDIAENIDIIQNP